MKVLEQIPGMSDTELATLRTNAERLSKDGTVACATCHDVSRGFTDRRSVSERYWGTTSSASMKNDRTVPLPITIPR